MENLTVILAYLVIGFTISFYLGKRWRQYYEIVDFIKSGLIVLFWPIGVMIGIIISAIVLIGVIAFFLGRFVYFMDDKKKEETHETKTIDE